MRRHAFNAPMSGARQHGFTLMEVLIAVTITALIGVGLWQLMSGAITAKGIIDRNSDQLTGLQRAISTIDRDIREVSSRTVRDAYGDTIAAITNREEGVILDLTRAGWRNPMGDPRSELQRVRYRLEDGALLREYWRVLDRAQDAEPVRQVLLADVESVDVRFYEDKKGWQSSWPTDAQLEEGNAIARLSHVPKGVEIILRQRVFGELRRVYSLVDSPKFANTDDAEGGDGNNGGDATDDTGAQDEQTPEGGFDNTENQEIDTPPEDTTGFEESTP